MFQKLHVAYTDMFCNPFYNPGENITSRFVTARTTVVKPLSLSFFDLCLSSFPSSHSSLFINRIPIVLRMFSRQFEKIVEDMMKRD